MNTKILLEMAQEIGARVCEIIMRSSDLGAYTGTIGQGGDRTKYGDQLVENGLRAIVPLVLEKHSLRSALVISEEAGRWVIGNKNGMDGVFMIIDPVDGSRNMRDHATPFPFLGFSIALGFTSDLINIGTFEAVRVGLIRDIFHNEEYYAIRGQGSYLNGIKLQSSPVTDISQVYLGVSLDRQGEKLQELLDKGVLKLLLASLCQRRLGLTTLDLCRVATGDYDAHVAIAGGVKIHDVAAAKLIVEEAGGAVRLIRNTPDKQVGRCLEELYKSDGDVIRSISFKLIAAGNSELLEKVASYLAV